MAKRKTKPKKPEVPSCRSRGELMAGLIDDSGNERPGISPARVSTRILEVLVDIRDELKSPKIEAEE